MTPKPTPEMCNKITKLCSIFNKPLTNIGEDKTENQVSQKKGKKLRKKSAEKGQDDASSTSKGDKNDNDSAMQMETNEEKESVENQNSSNNCKTSVSGEPGQEAVLETPLGDSSVVSEQDAPSLNGNTETRVASSTQSAVMHTKTVEELVALLKTKKEAMQGLIGISAQSTKDARLLRKRTNTVWTKCIGESLCVLSFD